ncbi:MAG: hypothetical protein ACP5SH_01345 [Syntrophobacteraceae bacterium]
MKKHEEALRYTISHFKEIARQNRSAENADILHDRDLCAICNPDAAGPDPFPVYLEVVVEQVLVRRPILDDALIAELNSDREMAGLEKDVTASRLLGGDPDAMESWVGWVRDALATGLGLLSIHSAQSLDFDLDEQEEAGYAPLIESKIRHIIKAQKKGC